MPCSTDLADQRSKGEPPWKPKLDATSLARWPRRWLFSLAHQSYLLSKLRLPPHLRLEESRRDVPAVATRSMGSTTFPARAPMTVTARKITSWLTTHSKNTSHAQWMLLRGRLDVPAL